MGALESVGGVGWDGDVAGVGEQQLGGGEVAGVFGGKGREGGRKDKGREGGRKDKGKGVRKRVWTAYLVFFGQLEGEMRGVLRGSGYGVCWRGWNGWGNEDWRRRGGMVVWCLDEGEKARWKEEEERIEAEGREGWKGWRRLVEW